MLLGRPALAGLSDTNQVESGTLCRWLIPFGSSLLTIHTHFLVNAPTRFHHPTVVEQGTLLGRGGASECGTASRVLGPCPSHEPTQQAVQTKRLGCIIRLSTAARYMIPVVVLPYSACAVAIRRHQSPSQVVVVIGKALRDPKSTYLFRNRAGRMHLL